MPDLFSPYTLKGSTLRNRIVVSPITMYNSVDGKLDYYYVSGSGHIYPMHSLNVNQIKDLRQA